MKVLRLHQPFDMRFSDEPVPDVGPDEVLIKVASVGVCASDVQDVYKRQCGMRALVLAVFHLHR